MPRFRAPRASVFSGVAARESLAVLVPETMRPAHFFLGPEFALEWEDTDRDDLAWDIFQGRLLDPAHTRQRRTFAAWKIYATNPAGTDRSSEPLLAVYFDAEAGQLHVVRGLDSYVWEGYDAGGNVYLSRERRKWVRELVATAQLDRFADAEELRDELACAIFQAVVGTSRLPLSSIETPLPAFSFGQFFYCYRPDAPRSAGSVRSWRGLVAEMLSSSLNPREEAHLLETFLHAAPLEEMSDAAEEFVRRWSKCGRNSTEISALLRALFNEVSLSPYTDLVDKTLAFLRALEAHGVFQTDQVVDFLSYLLRHIGRHLTAFDLIVFHHRGANYPDALLLDSALKEYLSLLERRPDLFRDATPESEPEQRRKRIRRRALRQGWLLRRRYKEHTVPDLPTSPGENMRVLPPNHPRVPEEQITQPSRRSRRLYAGDSLLPRLQGRVGEVLRQSLLDLDHAEEWREVGLGVFLDRPFGTGKAAAEPDCTLLLSAEAFSISIARQRLLALAGDLGLNSEDAFVQHLLSRPPLPGLPLEAIGGAIRPGAVSLADARRAAMDFVFLRSTPSTARALFEQYDFTPLRQAFSLDDVLDGKKILIARAAASSYLVVYDAQFRPRLELEADTQDGFAQRAGQEFPIGGLLVRCVGETMEGGEVLQTHDHHNEPIRLPPR